jgi:hypothetical protein
MNCFQLRKVFDSFGVQPSTVSFGVVNLPERYTILYEDSQWHVFYSERGNRNSESIYDTEADACDDLLFRIAKDPTTHTKS